MILTTALYEKNFRHVLKSDNWFFNFKSDIIVNRIVKVDIVAKRLRWLRRSVGLSRQQIENKYRISANTIKSMGGGKN